MFDRATYPTAIDSLGEEAERAFARALADGDERAFELLYERETHRVFRACYRVLGRIDDAEEATQEAFVAAYRGLSSYRGDGHPTAWLMRIAVRGAWRRSAAAARRRSQSAPLDVVMEMPTPEPDPGSEVMLAHERALVREAVAQLDDPYREIITLRYFGDLSLREIAAATGRPEGTVKAQIHRGLKRLRELATAR